MFKGLIIIFSMKINEKIINTGVFKKKAPCPWEFSISLYIFTSSSYVFIYAFCIFCIVFACIFDIRWIPNKRGAPQAPPHLLPIYPISQMHTKTIQKIQKAYIKTYEEDVKIYKDIENSQGTLLLQKCRPLYS